MDPLVVTRRTSAGTDRLWAVATDLARADQTMSAILAVDVLTPPPFGVGTRWRETRRMMKREATEEMWVTDVEPGRSYTAEAESGGAHYVMRFACTPSPTGGSDVTMTFVARPTGRLGRVLSAVMAPLSRRQLREQLERDLADLVAAAERG